MTPAVRHYHDKERYFNGRDGGEWTVCGKKWERQPAGVVVDCPECLELVRQRRIAR